MSSHEPAHSVNGDTQKAKATDQNQDGSPRRRYEVEVQCGPADVDALKSQYASQAPSWRKTVGEVAKEIYNNAVRLRSTPDHPRGFVQHFFYLFSFISVSLLVSGLFSSLRFCGRTTFLRTLTPAPLPGSARQEGQRNGAHLHWKDRAKRFVRRSMRNLVMAAAQIWCKA